MRTRTVEDRGIEAPQVRKTKTDEHADATAPMIVKGEDAPAKEGAQLQRQFRLHLAEFLQGEREIFP